MAPGLHLNSTSSQPASSPQELLKVPSRTISVLSLVILSVQGDLPYSVEMTSSYMHSICQITSECDLHCIYSSYSQGI